MAIVVEVIISLITIVKELIISGVQLFIHCCYPMTARDVWIMYRNGVCFFSRYTIVMVYYA